MKRLVSALLVAVFAMGSVSAIACGDKAKDEKQNAYDNHRQNRIFATHV